MSVYDLTRTVSAETMAYPGTEPASLTLMNTIEKDGFRETLLHMYSHTGTHMDAPAHMLDGGAYLDVMPPETFFGRAYVMDASAYGEGEVIEAGALPDLDGLDYLIISTGWEDKWGTPAYFGRFPVLSDAAAAKIAASGLKGLGVDMMSVDPMDTVDYPVHMRLFRAGKVDIENLTGLAPLRGRHVSVAALPFKYKNADGAPARVLAWD